MTAAPRSRRAVLCLIAGGLLAGLSDSRGSATEFIGGRLLVADPDMPDGRFSKTVIYMCRHDMSGAMGLVLNRPIGERPAAELLHMLGREAPDDPSSPTIRVHWGGPVDLSAGFLLHSSEYHREDTLQVSRSVGLSVDVRALSDIASGKGPRRSLFALGYSGWGPGQLERELARDSWVVAPADDEILFDDDIAGKWDRALGRDGVDL